MLKAVSPSRGKLRGVACPRGTKASLFDQMETAHNFLSNSETRFPSGAAVFQGKSIVETWHSIAACYAATPNT
jgi:hypothetical protein